MTWRSSSGGACAPDRWGGRCASDGRQSAPVGELQLIHHLGPVTSKHADINTSE